MKIAQIQMPVSADKSANIARACNMIRWSGQIDMAVLPEMFCCPYDNALFRDYAETEGGPAYSAMRRASSSNRKSKQMQRPMTPQGVSKVVTSRPGANTSDSRKLWPPSTSMSKRWVLR